MYFIEMASLASAFHKFHSVIDSDTEDFLNNSNLHLAIKESCVITGYIFMFVWDDISFK